MQRYKGHDQSPTERAHVPPNRPKADTNDNGQIAQKRRRGSGSNHHDGGPDRTNYSAVSGFVALPHPKKKSQQVCRKGSAENGVLKSSLRPNFPLSNLAYNLRSPY